MKTLAVVADFRKQSVHHAIQEFRSWMEKRVTVVGWYQSPEYLKKDLASHQIDYILVFGGDGLLLSTARILEGDRIPVMGVNFGKLGFLTELRTSELKDGLEQILSDNCRVAVRMMLKCEILREQKVMKTCLALNDGVVRSGQSSRLLYCSISVGGEEVSKYGGDGVIISTPTGSTAYSLSAGGPVLSPNLQALVITPICPHVLTMRPIVVSSNECIEVAFSAPFPGEANFNADGETFELQENDIVRISQSEKSFYLLETGQRSYFKILREKLGWGRQG